MRCWQRTVNRHGRHWVPVAREVGTKTITQCRAKVGNKDTALRFDADNECNYVASSRGGGVRSIMTSEGLVAHP